MCLLQEFIENHRYLYYTTKPLVLTSRMALAFLYNLCYNHKIMTHTHDSFPHPDSDSSHLDRVEDTPFERLNGVMQAAIDKLDLYQVEPNSITHDTQRIPFGRSGDGSLATSMTVDEGYLSGIVSFIAPKGSDTRDSFILRRDIGDAAWHSPSNRTATNAVLARRLDVNWPSHIDNTAIRQASRDENVTLETIFQIIEKDLAPHAPYFMVEKIYAYSNIQVNSETGACRTLSEVHLAAETDHDGFRTVTVQTKVADQINGLATAVYCRATSDQMGDVFLSAWYDHPETGTRVDKPIHDSDQVAAGLEGMISLLLEEKLAA